MKNYLSAMGLGLFMAMTTGAAQATSNAVPAAVPLEDPKYTTAIEGRTADILKLLGLNDSTKESAVHDIIMAQYRALFAWHELNDPKRKELAKQERNPDASVAAEAKK